MGGSSSKEESDVDNKGLLNGNFNYNGNIVDKIEEDLTNEGLLLKIVITLKIIHILIVLIKAFIKYLKRREGQNRKIEEILLKSNRQ